jgi:hypothetical protein
MTTQTEAKQVEYLSQLVLHQDVVEYLSQLVSDLVDGVGVLPNCETCQITYCEVKDEDDC